MEIKVLPLDDFMKFLNLYMEMRLNLNLVFSEYLTVAGIIDETRNKEDYTILGLYEDNELIGFVSGYALSKKVFYFSGIYVKMKYKYTKELIEKAFEHIQEKGYAGWEADCNSQISSILEKYGAVKMYTRYGKEF